MYDQQLHNAWNDMNDAINDNKQALGSEQYTRLINLMDTLANIGDDYAFELTNAKLAPKCNPLIDDEKPTIQLPFFKIEILYWILVCLAAAWIYYKR